MNPIQRGVAMLALMALAGSAFAAKPPTLIRQHLLDHPDLDVARVKSVEPHRAEALDAVVDTTVWKVAYSGEDARGESLVFMAVTDDGEVLRIHDFSEPAARDNFVRLLRDDVRVQSIDDARRLVSATLQLYFGFPFSEPELTADEMRAERQGDTYYLVDGERFGDATGYRIETDGDGRVVGYAYSWELPVAPLAD
jgi:hypothetical protein